jgi:prevent-host-death family protein
MSATVGAYEAKTHFAQLLDRVAQGETITVSRHGTVVAKIAPADRTDQEREADIRDAIEGMKKLAARQRLDGLDLLALRDEGKR